MYCESGTFCILLIVSSELVHLKYSECIEAIVQSQFHLLYCKLI